MERRDTMQPVHCTEEEEKRSIFGIGAVYYDGTENTQFRLWENTYERIMPGAFDRAIAEDDVRGLFNHDSNMVLGRTSAGTMTLRSTDDGLVYDIEPGNTTVSRDVAEHIRRGDVSGSSFAFTVTEEEWTTESRGTEDERDIRLIKDVALYDVGPVTFPAYQATTTETKCEARAAYESYLAIRDAESDSDEHEADEGVPLGCVDVETYRRRVRAAQAD